MQIKVAGEMKFLAKIAEQKHQQYLNGFNRSRIGENMKDRYLFKAKRTDNGEWVKGALVYDDRDKLYRIITEIN